MPQLMSKRSKFFNKLGSLFFIAASLFLSGFLIYGLIYVEDISFTLSTGFMFLASIGGLALGIFSWSSETENIKEENALIKKQQDEFWGNLWKKWYFRYLCALFVLGIAYAIHHITNAGIKPHGLGFFLFNPIIMWLCIAMGVVSAWEVSLSILMLLIIYLLFKVVMMLPVNILIILGVIAICLFILSLKTIKS